MSLEFKDRHMGKRIWVCGSGGSLLDVDETKIPKDDIIMCCNSSTFHFKERIDYCVFTDGAANWSDWYTKLKDVETTIILLLPEIAIINKNTILIEKDFSRWKMSKDDDKIIGGYDVIHCAVHIAYIMGASEIILAGVDLRHYMKGKKYPYPQDLDDTAPEPYKEWFNREMDIINKSEGLFDGLLGISLGGWKLIKEQNDLPIRSIAVNGNLNLYPTISFNDLIKEIQ